mmetsp:Transcript_62145/g.128902  ORF Transcript_62145/g.128902 Transcript_62145/m.128902 type:complete len:253 (-) Transcript_62145:1635-2393(-)
MIGRESSGQPSILTTTSASSVTTSSPSSEAATRSPTCTAITILIDSPGISTPRGGVAIIHVGASVSPAPSITDASVKCTATCPVFRNRTSLRCRSRYRTASSTTSDMSNSAAGRHAVVAASSSASIESRTFARRSAAISSTVSCSVVPIARWSDPSSFSSAVKLFCSHDPLEHFQSTRSHHAGVLSLSLSDEYIPVLGSSLYVGRNSGLPSQYERNACPSSRCRLSWSRSHSVSSRPCAISCNTSSRSMSMR